MPSTASATTATPDDVGDTLAAIDGERTQRRDRERHRFDDDRLPRLPSDWGDPFSLTNWLLPEA